MELIRSLLVLVSVSVVLCRFPEAHLSNVGGSPRTAPPNSFFKHVYHGRLSDVDDILQREPYRAYETDEFDNNVLQLALMTEHSEVALRLLDEYERDLNVLQSYFADQDVAVAKTRWMGRPILIAAGDERTQLVKSLITREIQFQTNVYGERKGLVVLTKPTSADVKQEVFWLSPPGSSHDYQIAKIVQALYSNGTIDVLRKSSYPSLLQIASQNGLEEVFLRLERLFGDGIAWNGTDYYPLLCQLANGVKHKGNHLEAFKEYITKINRFELKDVVLTESAVYLLEVPFQLNQSSIFEFMLDEIEKERNLDKTALLTEFVHSSNSFVWDFVDRSFLADLCLKYNVNLVNRVENTFYPLGPLGIFYRINEHMAIDAYLLEHFSEVLAHQGALQEILKNLIFNNRTTFISELFQSHPNLNEAAINVTETIQFAYVNGYVEVASLLINLNVDQLTDEDLYKFLNDFSKTERYVPLLRQVLGLPQAEDLIVKHQSTEPLSNALSERKLKNYRVLFDSILKKEDFPGLKEGSNLLASAIWVRKDVRVEKFRSDRINQPFEPEHSEYDDDAPESDVKTNSSKPYVWSPSYEQHSAEYYVKEKEQFDAIFLEMIELGCDYRSPVNGRSLLHAAVQRDNVLLVEKLIELGVDATTTDKDGNLPVHLVRSVDAFNVLITKLQATDFTSQNSKGQTPVDVVASSDCGGKYQALIEAMVAKGAAEPEVKSCPEKPDGGENVKESTPLDTDPLFGRPLPGLSKFDSALYQESTTKRKILKAVQLIALTEDPAFERLGYCDTTDRLLTPNHFIRTTVLACLCEAKYKDLL